MGISLRDLKQVDHWFDVDFWNRRPIVEGIRQLGILPDERVAALHEPCDNARGSRFCSRRRRRTVLSRGCPTARLR